MANYLRIAMSGLALVWSPLAQADVICPMNLLDVSTTPDGWISISVGGAGYTKSWWICPTAGSTTVNDGYSSSRTITSDGCKTMYSMLLTAKASNRPIMLVFNGPANCAGGSLPADGFMSLFPSRMVFQ